MSAIANGGILYGAEPKVEQIVNGDVNIEIDNALSTASTNPVQNKAVTEAINEIINDINDATDSISGLTNTISDVDAKATEATNIAKGRNQSHVFATTADMEAWLSNPDNKGLWSVPDNIYIVDLDVPDWWIAEVLDEADPDTGYYYKIEMLETQKVDLSNYIARGSNARLNMVALGDSDTPTIYADDKGDIGFKFKDSTGVTHYKTMETIKTDIESKLPSSGGTMTGDLITKDIIPYQANVVRLGINEKPFSSVRTNILDLMKNGATYAFMRIHQEGTTTQNGLIELRVGNLTPTGTNGNARGEFVMYNKNANFAKIKPNDNSQGDVYLDLPTKGGTLPSVSLSGTTLTINL